jgi:hypothetical protein
MIDERIKIPTEAEIKNKIPLLREIYGTPY